MPWLFNEDSALKIKLQGLTVSDANNSSRPVPVRFRLPEAEVADLTFPIIVISHNGWYPAPERMHDGYAKLPYAPEGLPAWFPDTGSATTTFLPSDSPYWSWFPTPYNFDYQVTVYCRFMHEHTIPLTSALAQYDRLPARFGFLDIPEDGTKRTLQLLGGPELQTGKDANGKRLFWVNYVIRVFSELVPAITMPVLAKTVNLDLSVYSDTNDILPATLTESRSLLSVGTPIAWNTNQLNSLE
jgi:hypothetical protein